MVTAAPDHLDRFIKTPRIGLLELIWNALDADADDVHVDLNVSGMGGVLSVVVSDNGTGIPAESAEIYFSTLGGSWKKMQATTEKGRALHGRLGGGRFAAYGIGDEVVWTSTARSADGQMKETVIKGSRALAQEFDIESKDSTSTKTGTTVEIGGLSRAAAKYVDLERVADDLTSALAIYIMQYHPHVFWRAKELDPQALVSDRSDTNLQVDHDGKTLTIPFTIIEWTAPFDRALYLCNEKGVALHEVRPGIQAPGYHFTAYVKWDGFANRTHDVLLEGAAEEPVPTIIDAAQDALREHFRQRREEKYTRMIADWKKDKTYPFEGPADKKVEKATRDLFDIVAVAAAPAVEKADPAARKLSLRLLREAIENSPDTVHTLMQEVLNLTDQDAEDLRLLIEKTSLSGIISSAKTISDRLEFLASLEAIVNEPDLKKVVKERSQLHRILAGETWVFREEYALVGDDQTLRTVLRSHLDILGNDVLTTDDVEAYEVVDEGGSVRVVDLLLSKVITQRQEHHENIVIELKRPSVHVGAAELSQIENYAMAAAEDKRFTGTDTRWEFWIIGDNLTGAVSIRANQTGREPGVTLQTDAPLNMIVRALTWAQVIRNAKHRLQFVRESLDYDPSTEAGLNYLREKHAQYLPDIMLGDKTQAAIEAPTSALEATPDTGPATS